MTLSSSASGLCALAAAGALAGCAARSDYVYAPDTANATLAGLPAARTAIPPERPDGAIEVTSYGVTTLRQDATTIPALHVRAVITNDGDPTPWRLDTSQQMVAIPGEGQSRAMFVNSDVGTLPNVTIGQHERRVLDFYFPLPDTIHRESQLPRFDLLWQVITPARTVASRTSFERMDREPDYAYDSAPVAWPLWAGYGPYWWYDPFYPNAVFVHSHRYAGHGGHVGVGHFGGHFAPGGHAAVASGHHR